MKTIWVVLLTVLITGGLVGGGTYYCLNKKADKEKSDLSKQIESLQADQIALQNNLNELKTSIVEQEKPASSDLTSDWKTYTNPTFGYSIKYPPAWTVKQSNTLDGSSTEADKDMSIIFSNSGTMVVRIFTRTLAKTGELSLSEMANEIPAPKDHASIKGVTTYDVGGLDGYRRLVTITDPASSGLEYITKDTKYVYTFTTLKEAEQGDVTNMLTTFSAK